MTECEEVALAMVPSFMHWIGTLPIKRVAVHEFVRQQMLDESETVRQGVAWALWRYVNTDSSN